MIELFALLAGSWLVLTFLGVALLAPFRAGIRHAWLPAAPVLGACLIAVVLSTTSKVATSGWGLAIAVTVAVACAVFAARRGLLEPPSRRAWVLAGIAWAIGLVGMALALLPSFTVGDGNVLSPGPNHDSFFYAAESGWLRENLVTDAGEIATAPGLGGLVPGFGPALSANQLSLRIGQAMVQSALTSLFHTDEVATTVPMTALWVLVIPGAFLTAGRLLRMRLSAAIAGGVVLTTATLIIQLTVNQNNDSLLGVSIALLCLGAAVAGANGRSNVWLGALIVAALIAVYTEYAVFVAPAVIGGVLLRRTSFYRRTVARGLVVVILAVLMAPFAWSRALRWLLNIPPSGFDSLPSAYGSDGWTASFNRIIGAAPPTDGSMFNGWVVLVLAVATIGLVATLMSPHRGLYLCLVGACIGYTALLTLQQRGYTQSRAVMLVYPLMVFAVAGGYSAVITWLRHRSGRAGTVSANAVGVVALFGVLVTVTVNVPTTTALAYPPQTLAGRHVSQDYRDAAEWVAEVSDQKGANVTAMVPDYFQQLWIAFLLRDEDNVAYPSLHMDYLRTKRYWGGETDRYLLVGKGTSVDADPSVVVRSNSTFQLLDLQAGPVVAAMPFDSTDWEGHLGADGVVPCLAAQCPVLVLRSPSADPDVSLELAVDSSVDSSGLRALDSESGAVTAVQDGGEVRLSVVVDDSYDIVTVELEDGTPIAGRLQLNGVRDGA